MEACDISRLNKDRFLDDEEASLLFQSVALRIGSKCGQTGAGLVGSSA